MGSCFSVGLNTGNSGLDVPPSYRRLQSEAEILQSGNLKSFSFDVLKRATGNFHPTNALGKAEFSSVKGWIDEQSLVAAKPGTGTAIVVMFYRGYAITHQEWLAEISYLGRLNHQNLVKLIGYCLDGDNRFLVYEFVQRGSLNNHLFKRGANFERLTWNLRIEIALGVAKGLVYLHSTATDVRFLEFSSSNILIDSNYNAKLLGFEFANPEHSGYTQVWCASIASLGHERLDTGHLTARGEIHSFGVLLLELLTGRPSFDKNRPSGEERLDMFAKTFLTSYKKILHIMDPSIQGQYSSAVAKQAALLAMKCLLPDPTHSSPNAEELVKALEEIQELQKASKSSTNEQVPK